MKIYNNNNKKYRGEEYNILDIKLQVFYNYCTKVRLLDNQFHLVFSIILKSQASTFYYNKISRRSYDFTIIIEITKTYFETEERYQKYLIEQRSTILYCIIVKYPEKSQPEYLELLFDILCTIQYRLSIEYQNEYNLQDQVINTYIGILEYYTILFRLVLIFEGVYTELQSVIR